MKSSSPFSSGRTWQFVGLGLLVIAAGLAARDYLFYESTLPRYNPAPAPRLPRNAPFVKSPDQVVERMLALAKINSDDLVYDLGCGDGRLVVTAAAKYGCRGIGFDIDPERIAEATENAKTHQVDHLVEIRQQDVFTVDLSKADVVVMYLLPWMVKELIPEFRAMKPGCRIVSHDFPIEGILPDHEEEIFVKDQSDRHVIYRYVTPLRSAERAGEGMPPKDPSGTKH